MLFTVDIIECKNPRQEAANVVAGLNKLGNGCFGTVYANNTDQVIKVSTGNDWGYTSFLEAMSQHPEHNPWLPRVQWVRIFMSNIGYENDNRIVTCLERLERPWEDSGYIPEMDLPSVEYWQKCVSRCKEIESYMYSENKQKDWINQDHKLMAALKVVRQAMRASGRKVDMHCGNFMMRGDQLVITDPIGF